MSLLQPTHTKYSDEIRAQVVALTLQGLSTRAIERRILDEYGYAPGHSTIAEWQQDIDMAVFTRGQSQQLIARTGHLLHSVLDRVSDIADKPDVIKHGFLLNAIRGTAMDKELQQPAISVHVDQVLVQQLVAMTPEALEALAARGKLLEPQSDSE